MAGKGDRKRGEAAAPQSNGGFLVRGKIGIALGSGAARGWAHVGVLKALEAAGIRPEVVCGTSIGSVVGAAYAAGSLDALEAWVKRLERRHVASYLDLGFRGGLLRARKVFEALAAEIADRPIESLPCAFAAVATDLASGNEVWLREGSLYAALRASVALPGLVSPVHHGGRWLVDGGLVNPVPVSVCRALGADTVIGVDLNTTLIGRRLRSGGRSKDDEDESPSILEVISNSINIMQVRVTRSRMAGDPPDLLVTPQLPDFGILDFDRADVAVAEGRDAVERALAAAHVAS
jgi:NTE family protein